MFRDFLASRAIFGTGLSSQTAEPLVLKGKLLANYFLGGSKGPLFHLLLTPPITHARSRCYLAPCHKECAFLSSAQEFHFGRSCFPPPAGHFWSLPCSTQVGVHAVSHRFDSLAPIDIQPHSTGKLVLVSICRL